MAITDLGLEGLIWNELAPNPNEEEEVIYFILNKDICYFQNKTIREVSPKLRLRNWEALVIYQKKLFAVEAYLGEKRDWTALFDIRQQEQAWTSYRTNPRSIAGDDNHIILATGETVKIYTPNLVKTLAETGKDVTSVAIHQEQDLILKDNQIVSLSTADILYDGSEVLLQSISSFNERLYALAKSGALFEVNDRKIVHVPIKSDYWIRHLAPGTTTMYDVADISGKQIVRKTFSGEIVGELQFANQVKSAIAVPIQIHKGILEEVNSH